PGPQMRLSDLAAEVPGAIVSGPEYNVGRVVLDSRHAGPGDLFVAVPGSHADGHDFAAAAAAAGAAIAVERDVALPDGSAWLRLPAARPGLAELAAAMQGRPARRLLVVGVTGTEGKTTTTHMTAHVLERAGLASGYLSTVAHSVAGVYRPNDSGMSTMQAPQVQEQLARMLAGGARAAVIEATSHALDQDRVGACEFDVAAYTNVSSDHLDYHGTAEAYRRAKLRLIDLCAASFGKRVQKTAVLNRDDASFEMLAARPIARRLTYGIDSDADVRATDLAPADSAGTTFQLRAGGRSAPVHLHLPGRYNVANALCAGASCLALGLTLDQVAAGLSDFAGVRGRLESVDLGQAFRLYVDFADSPFSLNHMLSALRPTTRGRLMVMFGATARSDHGRAEMGRAASDHADFFVITTDDPLGEDPAELARCVQAGVVGRDLGRDYEVVLDRAQAIRRILAVARPGDVVVLAGKGHEQTMMLAGGNVPWDDRGEAERALRELGLAAE
ncbi:MAG TPA: UDP-N-acetylmuramoyl-L-alanyl-D-glutamate--2,6-diaminopimelate ligase, partial [Candidatus Dormibacteraeota bacterium]